MMHYARARAIHRYMYIPAANLTESLALNGEKSVGECRWTGAKRAPRLPRCLYTSARGELFSFFSMPNFVLNFDIRISRSARRVGRVT